MRWFLELLGLGLLHDRAVEWGGLRDGTPVQTDPCHAAEHVSHREQGDPA